MENRIVINYGKEIQKVTYECLKEYNAAALIKKGQKVIIKPNLVNSSPAIKGATTHPEVIEGVITYLFDNGHTNIEIAESSWAGGNTDEAFRVCGYSRISEKYGVPCKNVLKYGFETVSYKGLDIEISSLALEGAFLINVPVLKAHCQTSMTCCIKNLKGLIPADEKRRFHTLGLHAPIAALGAVIKTGLNVVDSVCGDLTFEEGGTPVEANMILVGEDPLLLDSFAAEFIGYAPDDIKYLKLAKEYGVGVFYSEKTEVVVLNSDKKPGTSTRASGVAAALARYVDEKDACSVCYSSLIRALYKADKRRLGGLKGKIAIGQGFKGVEGEGIGFGSCTSGFSQCVHGCPPKALDILKKL